MGVDPEALIQGLQLPDKPAREAKVDGVKMVVLEAKLTNDQMKAREGTYFNEKGITVYDEDVDIYDANTKKLLARFRKNVIPKEDINTWLRERLPGYKVPRLYHFVEELPRNAMGKVTKNDLKIMF